MVTSSSSSVTSSSVASSSSAPNLLKIEAMPSNFCAHSGAYEIEHLGFDGDGYYNGSNNAGAGFNVAIHADSTGDYALKIKYANGGMQSRSANVQTGPRHPDKNIEFTPTAAWTDWQELTTTVRLDAGKNVISLTAFNNDGLANIDSIALVGSGLSIDQCPEQKPVDVPFIIGMDISSIPELIDFNVTFIDTDGNAKDIFTLLKNHGVNYILLRTFVNPLATAGYASADAVCPGKSEAYNDQAHLIAFAKEVKRAGLGLLVDLQYSDTWTDPAKQIIPEAWRGITSLSAMATQVRTYTREIITALDIAGARPDMVQIGNEATAGCSFTFLPVTPPAGAITS